MNSFASIKACALQTGQRVTLGVVGADDTHSLEAVIMAVRDDLVTPVLYGDEDTIRRLWEQLAPDLPVPTVVDAGEKAAAAEQAAADACCGSVACLFKGHIETVDFMRAIVKRKDELLVSPLISALAFFETPSYHKIFAITDPAVNMYPNLAQKESMVKNAITAFRALGVERPKVAVLTAVDFVNPKMPDCVDAEKLVEACARGEFGNALVDGPMSFDLAYSKEAAGMKHYDSEVAGDADIILSPDIVSANALTKSLIYAGNGKNGGVLMGARIPILMSSRASSSADKYNSVLFAAAIAAGLQKKSG